MYVPSAILSLFITNFILQLEASVLPRTVSVPILKIVGGVTVDIDQYSYQVSVQVLQHHVCGGSIISKQYVLTAAHCIIYHVSLYTIRAGSSYHASGGQVIKALSITPHPNYERVTQNNDIAVILLEGELILGVTIGIIDLPDEDQEIEADAEAVVTGWGNTGASSISDQLQAVTLSIVDKEQCASIFATLNNKITESMICAGYTGGGRDACQGDSGGPLVINNQLIGIISWGKGCANGYPGVYSNVRHLRSFISNVTGI